MKKQPAIKTERLILRPFAISDAREVQRLVGERAIADTTLNIPYPYENGMAEKWILTNHQKFQAGESAIFAILLQNYETLIGAIGLIVVPQYERAELGYWIGKSYWKNGYCTESARAILHYGFSVLGLNRIHASHLTRNPASGRVMQKIGMVYEGRAPQHVKKWDKFEDLELYGILRENWKKSKHSDAASQT